MLNINALRSMNVMFATPCYISAVTMNYTMSIFNLASVAKGLNLNCSLCMLSDSLITRARNLIVKKFLYESHYTHLFWIDSDISFEPSNILRILLSDRDVVAGTYPKKKMFWPEKGVSEGTTKEQFENQYTKFSFTPTNQQAIKESIDDENFMDVKEVPAGFMCIKRDVFVKLMDKYSELKFQTNYPYDPAEHLNWLFFDCMIEPETNRYLSEDYAFCKRWRDIGGKIYLDLDCNLGHLGQHLFKGNLVGCLTHQKDNFFTLLQP